MYIGLNFLVKENKKKILEEKFVCLLTEFDLWIKLETIKHSELFFSANSL